MQISPLSYVKKTLLHTNGSYTYAANSYTTDIPATNRPATNIHGEMPIKYIKHPPICGRLATSSTNFVLCERSDHLHQQQTLNTFSKLTLILKKTANQSLQVSIGTLDDIKIN